MLIADHKRSNETCMKHNRQQHDLMDQSNGPSKHDPGHQTESDYYQHYISYKVLTKLNALQ